MDWSQDIISGLPPPSELEPPTLRERIVAEISDHLQCAYQREIHHTQNEKQALSNIYKKFGNPATLARILWFDEMKGRLMLQKITLGLITVLCLAVGFLFYFVYAQMELQTTNNQKYYQEQQSLLLNAISEIKGSTPKHEPLILKLNGIPKDPNNPPIFDVNFTLGKELNIHKKIPLGSEYNFGLIDFGKCSLSITSPWGERVLDEFLVGPGRVQSFEFDCPAEKFSDKKINISMGPSIKEYFKLLEEETKNSPVKDATSMHSAIVIVYSIDKSDLRIPKTGRTSWRIIEKNKFPSIVIKSSNDRFEQRLPAGSKMVILYYNNVLLPATYQSQHVDYCLIEKFIDHLRDGDEYIDTNAAKNVKNSYNGEPMGHSGELGAILQRAEFYEEASKINGGNTSRDQEQYFAKHFVELQTYNVSHEDNQEFVIDLPKKLRDRIDEYKNKVEKERDNSSIKNK